MNTHDRDPYRDPYWARIADDAASVRRLPHSLRGGSTALAEELELAALEATAAELRRKISARKP